MKIRSRTLATLVLTLILVGWVVRSGHAEDDGAAFFARSEVCQIAIQVEPDSLAQLRKDPRNYVRATVRADGRDLPGTVAVKLKGAAGSFRDWDERPALTLNMRKFHKEGDFHGLVKFHLNNSVQDEAYFNEILSAELFHQAGVPAPRVTFARVTLNGRDVGLYVLKEGFDRPFLERSFADATGNLYDGGFCQDINADLEKDEGTGPDDRSDLRALVEATQDSNPAHRRERLAALLDLPEFCTFMAIERMIAHWDGYCNKANNYRVYFDPSRQGRAVFLPHGMDQVFEDPNANLFEPSPALVARAILQNPPFRQLYHARLAALISLLDPADTLLRRVDEIDARIRPELVARGDRNAQAHRDEQVANLKQRLIHRAASLRQQINTPEEPTLAFDDQGIAHPADWFSRSETKETTLDEVDLGDGKRALHIQSKPGHPCVASWRARVVLGPGEYTIEAQIRTEQVIERGDSHRSGVGVGRSGTDRDQHRHGSIDSEVLTCRLPVVEDRTEVILVLELRAESGQVWFDRDSIRLIRHAADPAR